MLKLEYVFVDFEVFAHDGAAFDEAAPFFCFLFGSDERRTALVFSDFDTGNPSFLQGVEKTKEHSQSRWNGKLFKAVCTTPFFFYKNTFYKNIQAEIAKKLRTS